MPTIIYWMSLVLLILAYIVQIVAVFSIVVSLFTRNSELWCEGIKDLFESGVQIRNVSYFLLFFIVFISTNKFYINGENSLELVANIGKVYGIASLFSLLVCVFSMIVRALKKTKSTSVVELIKKCRKSLLFSIFSGFMVFYFTNPD